MEFTKRVISAWSEWPDADYYGIRDVAIAEFMANGKTDGLFTIHDGGVIMREFVDQESAEQWVAWVKANAPEGVVSVIHIEDIV